MSSPAADFADVTAATIIPSRPAITRHCQPQPAANYWLTFDSFKVGNYHHQQRVSGCIQVLLWNETEKVSKFPLGNSPKKHGKYNNIITWKATTKRWWNNFEVAPQFLHSHTIRFICFCNARQTDKKIGRAIMIQSVVDQHYNEGYRIVNGSFASEYPMRKQVTYMRLCKLTRLMQEASHNLVFSGQFNHGKNEVIRN